MTIGVWTVFATLMVVEIPPLAELHSVTHFGDQLSSDTSSVSGKKRRRLQQLES